MGRGEGESGGGGGAGDAQPGELQHAKGRGPAAFRRSASSIRFAACRAGTALLFHTPPHAGGALEEAPPEVYKNRNPTK